VDAVVPQVAAEWLDEAKHAGAIQKMARSRGRDMGWLKGMSVYLEV
jgi:hypothetical protein